MSQDGPVLIKIETTAIIRLIEKKLRTHAIPRPVFLSARQSAQARFRECARLVYGTTGRTWECSETVVVNDARFRITFEIDWDTRDEFGSLLDIHVFETPPNLARNEGA